MEDFILDNLGNIIFTLFIICLLSIPLLSEAECYAKTEGMGLQVEYSYLGGCRVEYQEGKWIPLDRYRIVEE